MSILDAIKGKQEPAVTTTTTVAAPTATTLTRPLRLQRDNAFPWRRFAISLMGIVIILTVWDWATWYLYTLPDKSVAVFGSITSNAMYVVGFLVAFFVTGQAYFTNWSNSSVSSIAAEVKTYLETKKEVTKPKKK